jgi:mannose-P-dolichol utilization defect protein 1
MDALRSTIQPLTRNLPTPIRNLGISLLGPDCYATLILDVNLESQECLKLAVSKGLGLGIIGVSSVVKIPQIIKLLSSRSAAGISFLSYVLETSAFLISLAYSYRQGFPFSTYGETAFISIQNIVIAILVLQFQGKAPVAAAFVAVLAAAVYALFTPSVVDPQILAYLQAAAGMLSVASKLPQIVTVWKEGGTGQLSAFAVSSDILTCFPLSYQIKDTKKNWFANCDAGVQLSRRFSEPHLHNTPRSGR